MRRSRRFRLADIPRIIALGVITVADLFGGRYRRTEGAHVIATDADGRILVVRPVFHGRHWMLPGGRVERGETPHAAAARETREETGLSVAVERLRFVDAHHARDTSFIFAGRVTGGTLEPQLGEIAEVGWLTREEIAAAAPRLDRLLRLVDEAGGGVGYMGLE
jgi:ADP-ribose pyrophosphatase YjhB (NUDIX family)